MFKFFLSSLGDDDMGGGDEQGRGGEHREAGEGDQAEPVQHHRSELPVVLHRVVLLVSLQLVVEDAQLLERGSSSTPSWCPMAVESPSPARRRAVRLEI